ncbi:hypothetical protein FACS189434_01460 [Bacteroidia bacterium]|nr:hypothetical protein FACS189434_01460 [Bacteroidia bacterium]
MQTQAQDRISYQAVVRIGEQNQLVSNTACGVKISILQGSENGSAIYEERHTVTTNANGLLTLPIGGGAAVNGTFAAIDWANAPYFVKTEIDPAGGTSYLLSSTTQLLTVPYALHAKTAEGISGTVPYDKITGVPPLIGFSGNYDDLAGKPALFSGAYGDLSGKPALFSGAYNDLSGKPALFSGNYDDLTNKPVIGENGFSGSYNDLSNKPALFSGTYADLTGKPALFDGNYNSLTNKPSYATVATTGSYSDLTNKPALFSGNYNDLTNKPVIGENGFSGNYNDLSNKPTLFSGVYDDLTNKPALFSGSYSDLTNKPDIKDSIATYGFSGDYLDLINKPAGGVTGVSDYNDLSNKPNIKDSIAAYLQDILADMVKIPKGTNKGDMLYWEDDKWNLLSIGLDGQVLVSVKGRLEWKDITTLTNTGNDLYQVGDVFLSYGEPEGIVIEVSEVGQYAKILSLKEYNVVWCDAENFGLTNAQNANNGSLNMNVIKQINNFDIYPAFKVCNDLDEGWYLPAQNEMIAIANKKDEIATQLSTVTGAMPMSGKFYWTSTETRAPFAQAVALADSTFTMSMEALSLIDLDFSNIFDGNGDIIEGLNPIDKDTTLVAGNYFGVRKSETLTVRPVRYLSWSEMNSKPKSDTQYNVGDVYPSVASPEGVVIEVWNGGLNGKIISLVEDSLQWSSETVLLNASSLSDGTLNRDAVKSHDISFAAYPAFQWCMAQGDQWFLPAAGELLNIYSNIDTVNTALSSITDAKVLRQETTSYWSSSEDDANNAFTVTYKTATAEDSTVAKTTKALIRAIKRF